MGWLARRAAASPSSKGQSLGACGSRLPVRRRGRADRDHGAPWKERSASQRTRHCLARAEPDGRASPVTRGGGDAARGGRGLTLRWSSLPDWSRWWRRSESPALAKYADALLAFLKQHVEEEAPESPAARIAAHRRAPVSEEVALDGRSARARATSGREPRRCGETAWVLHDLGALAVAAGVKPVAGEALEQAKGIYEQVGDHVGAEASSGALSQSAAVAPSALAVAAGVTVVAVAGVVRVSSSAAAWYFVDGKSASESPSLPTAEVIAFGVGNENRVPGELDERTDAPLGCCCPGESLAACEPLYVYDWVRFAGIGAETTSSEMSVDGKRFRRIQGAGTAPSTTTRSGAATTTDQEAFRPVTRSPTGAGSSSSASRAWKPTGRP